MNAYVLTMRASLIVPNFQNNFSKSFSLVDFENPLMKICGFVSGINKQIINIKLLQIIQLYINSGLCYTIQILVLRSKAMGSIFAHERRKKILIAEGDFSTIKDKFCLDNQNIQDLFECFRKFDRFDRSYIDFDDFIIYFRKNILNFVQLPFAQRLFRRIPKSQQSKIYFEEFVQGISAFCLLNYESILHFIFDYIDQDGDDRINKMDIIKLVKYTDPQNGKQTFFTNFSGDLQQFPMKENQNKMDFDHFRLNSDKILFLIWPAFSLQDYLRQKIMGTNFWISLYSKVQKKQIQIKNNQKKQQKMKQKLEILKNLKLKKVEDLLFKDKVNDRKPGQVSDDSKIYKRSTHPRRKSAVYIKQQLQINSSESQDPQK